MPPIIANTAAMKANLNVLLIFSLLIREQGAAHPILNFYDPILGGQSSLKICKLQINNFRTLFELGTSNLKLDFELEDSVALKPGRRGGCSVKLGMPIPQCKTGCSG
jgi:hypothetical protein